MTTDYRKIIIARLDELGIAGEEFSAKLAKYGAIMAGSFPLQCVLGEYYPNSDIDIFVPYNRDRYYIMGHKLHTFEAWLRQKYIKGKNIHELGSSEKYIHLGFISRKWALTTKVIFNVIIVPTTNLAQCIEASFDLSFCKTSFDGKNVRVTDMTLQKIGYIKPLNREKYKWLYDDESIEEIRHEEWYEADYYTCKLVERVTKYARRGFYIRGQVDRPTLIERSNIQCDLRQYPDTMCMDFHRESEKSKETKTHFLKFIENFTTQFFYEPRAVQCIHKLAGIAPVLFYSVGDESIIPEWLF